MEGTQFKYAIKFVADMDKAVKFYRDVLGLKVTTYTRSALSPFLAQG
jgi:predicted enzyme related to lactoylglutathione lyase